MTDRQVRPDIDVAVTGRAVRRGVRMLVTAPRSPTDAGASLVALTADDPPDHTPLCAVVDR